MNRDLEDTMFAKRHGEVPKRSYTSADERIKAAYDRLLAHSREAKKEYEEQARILDGLSTVIEMYDEMIQRHEERYRDEYMRGNRG